MRAGSFDEAIGEESGVDKTWSDQVCVCVKADKDPNKDVPRDPTGDMPEVERDLLLTTFTVDLRGLLLFKRLVLS